MKGRKDKKWKGKKEMDRFLILWVELHCPSRNSKDFFNPFFITFNAPGGMSPHWKNSLVLYLRKCCFTLSLLHKINAVFMYKIYTWWARRSTLPPPRKHLGESWIISLFYLIMCIHMYTGTQIALWWECLEDRQNKTVLNFKLY